MHLEDDAPALAHHPPTAVAHVARVALAEAIGVQREAVVLQILSVLERAVLDDRVQGGFARALDAVGRLDPARL